MDVFLRAHWILSVFCALAVTQQFARGDTDQQCPEGETVKHSDVTAGSADTPSIFDELTHDEIQRLMDFLFDQEDLNVQRKSKAMNVTYIHLMEILPPDKTAALEYLDNGGPRPPRYALVVLYRGDLETPVIEEYKVGSVEDEDFSSWTIEPRTRRGNYQHLFSTRSPDDELDVMEDFIYEIMLQLDPIVIDCSGYGYENCTDNCLTWEYGVPGDYISGNRKIFVYFLKDVEGWFLHPIGLQIRVNALSPHVEDWTVDFIWWRGHVYNSVGDMMMEWGPGSALRTAESQKEKVIVEDDRDSTASMNFRGEPRPEAKKRGPTSYYPDGRRYKIDGHHIEWQGWSFDFMIPSVRGMNLYDIRFLGDRIVYETGPKEVSVRYSGNSPAPMYTVSHDTFYFLGRNTFELLPEIDCPNNAEFFDFVHFYDGGPFKYPHSACVFEMNRGIPLRRHYMSDLHGGFDFVQGMQDNVLVMRSIITVWNYDYIVDYIFHQQGGIEVVTTLSGYVLMSYFMGESDQEFGFEGVPQALGNIHQHVLHFKVDLDIQGTKNRFETLDVKVEKEDDIDGGRDHYVYKFERNLRETELDAALKFDLNQPKYITFYQKNATNKYGDERRYRLEVLSVTPWLIPEESPSEKSFSWARYQVAVTKHKMEEDVSTEPYSSMDPDNPILYFQDFIDDNETIVDEDLVAWVTLGVVHIPHTEDYPVVASQGVQNTFHILPYNYFDEDISLSSRDNIRITPKGDAYKFGEYEYEYGGVAEELTCVPRDVVLPEIEEPNSSSTILPVAVAHIVGVLIVFLFSA